MSKNTRGFIVSLFLILASSLVVYGQTPSSISAEQLKKLDFLVGEWKGKGWMYSLDGKRSMEVSQSTKVKRGSDGLSLRISDKKKYPDLRIAVGNPFPGLILNYPMESSAPVTVSYDDAAKLYLWRYETSGFRKKPFQAMVVEDRTFQVKLEFPGSLSVITIKVTENGEWHERLDSWLGDKGGWFKSQETVLKKVK